MYSEVDVVVSHLELRPEVVRALWDRLSDGERLRAQRFRFERERRRFVVARARLRELLAERLEATPEAIELASHASGKPTLAGSFARSGWRFNLSHCDELAVYAFARGREVGIDVEALRALREADALVQRFFSPEENAAYRALEPQARPAGFFNCWTRKEAFVKALGEGLSLPLERFAVTLAPGAPAAVLRVAGARGDGGWRMHSFCPRPGYVAAVALAPG